MPSKTVTGNNNNNKTNDDNNNNNNYQFIRKTNLRKKPPSFDEQQQMLQQKRIHKKQEHQQRHQMQSIDDLLLTNPFEQQSSNATTTTAITKQSAANELFGESTNYNNNYKIDFNDPFNDFATITNTNYCSSSTSNNNYRMPSPVEATTTTTCRKFTPLAMAAHATAMAVLGSNYHFNNNNNDNDNDNSSRTSCNFNENSYYSSPFSATAATTSTAARPNNYWSFDERDEFDLGESGEEEQHELASNGRLLRQEFLDDVWQRSELERSQPQQQQQQEREMTTRATECSERDEDKAIDVFNTMWIAHEASNNNNSQQKRLYDNKQTDNYEDEAADISASFKKMSPFVTALSTLKSHTTTTTTTTNIYTTTTPTITKIHEQQTPTTQSIFISCAHSTVPPSFAPPVLSKTQQQQYAYLHNNTSQPATTMQTVSCTHLSPLNPFLNEIPEYTISDNNNNNNNINNNLTAMLNTQDLEDSCSLLPLISSSAVPSIFHHSVGILANDCEVSSSFPTSSVCSTPNPANTCFTNIDERPYCIASSSSLNNSSTNCNSFNTNTQNPFQTICENKFFGWSKF